MWTPLDGVRSLLERVRSPRETSEDDGASARSSAAERADTAVDEQPSTETEIRRLLDANGGRLKQQRIVDETGLSDASVSRYLASLERAGDVERVKTGRENVVVLLDGTSARERAHRRGERRTDDGK